MISCPWLPRRSLLRTAILAIPFAFTAVAEAQWTPVDAGTTASFRGMSVVSPAVAWISGTGGTFEWTDDSGRTWHAGSVPGATSRDFRAVHAFSLDTAVLMVSAQDTGLIYRTTDRGRSWQVQYSNVTKGTFLDGLAFFDARHGLAVGDPMDGRFLILETWDGGQHWARIRDAGLPPALPGEGAFAASGTSLVTCGSNDAWLGTGGAVASRVFHSSDGGRNWSVVSTPITAGTASAGIFSLACRDSGHLIAVGGNYSKPNPNAVTVATSDDGGATWVASSPAGSTAFLSGVAYMKSPGVPDGVLAVGTEGSVFSVDFGRTWKRIDRLSLNVVHARGDGAALAAGAHGSVAVMAGLPSM
jgi:photosystem II stability/assembly factor-like uncharacterized protein